MWSKVFKATTSHKRLTKLDILGGRLWEVQLGLQYFVSQYSDPICTVVQKYHDT